MATTAASSLMDIALAELPLAIVLLDPKRRVVSANPAACATLRAEGESLLGRDLTEIVRSEEPNWLSLDPVDRLGTPRSGRKLKARIGGVRRLLRVGVYPLQEAEQALGILVTLRDGRGVENDPGERRDHLTSLGELSAIVAHEIRNPLTGIRTTVQFVDSKMPPEDPKKEDLREVLNEIDRIEQIIQDLLLFARPVEGNRTRGDFNAFIGRVLDTMAPQFAEAEIEVKRNFSPDLPPFEFAPDTLQQVLQNLFRNAREAMPDGGRLKVTTTVRRFRSGRPPAAEIFVSDTGHGIPEDLLHDIFKPFFTTRHNGTGLGLPISTSIVRAHGGRITARNRVTGGATFRISLPMIEEPGSEP